MLAVGGGKGGVGKSLLSQSLAVYLAQIGRRVVLVDADPTGANLHLSLGATPPENRSLPVDEIEEALVSTSVPGLRLMLAPTEASSTGAIKTARRLRLLRTIRDLLVDDLIIDCGPGASATACDLFLAADIGIVVVNPEPAAIETTYRFLKAVFVRDLRRHLLIDRPKLRALDRVLSDLKILPLPIELLRRLAKNEPAIADAAQALLARLRPRLVVNQTRVRGDLELGPWMAQIASRRLGVELDPLGHVEHDDAVWLANRRFSPLLVDNPSSKAGRGLERIARRLIAATPQRARELEPLASPAKTFEELNFYERLLIARGSSEEEVRRAHKRQREIYAHGGLPTVSLFTDDELDQVHRDLDEAHDVLLEQGKRRAYDLSLFPEVASKSAPSPTERASNQARDLELLSLQAMVARELGPETEFSGSLLKRVRESKGLELRDLAARTKITLGHLQALEEEQFETLPPLVYVRGFLGEVAKVLGLDGALVSRTYLRRAREILALRGG